MEIAKIKKDIKHETEKIHKKHLSYLILKEYDKFKNKFVLRDHLC